jgi:hypothetical protein
VFERERRDLFGNRKFQRTTKALLGREVTVHVHESLSYAGTVTVDDGNAEEKLEAWLEEQGYRRNATAYLKYRMRDGRKEYEQGSWAYRKDVRADEQLQGGRLCRPRRSRRVDWRYGRDVVRET